MKQGLFIMAFIIAIAIITVSSFWFDHHTTHSTKTDPASDPSSSINSLDSSNNPPISDPDRDQNTVLFKQHIPTTESTDVSLHSTTDDTSLRSTPWQITDTYTATDESLPNISEKVSISLETTLVQSLEAGHTMPITLPDYSTHNAVIEQASEQASSKTLTGFLADIPNSQIIITTHNNAVYATISTIEGNYSLETIDGKGVLYRVPPRSEIETIETDALIPDREMLDLENEAQKNDE